MSSGGQPAPPGTPLTSPRNRRRTPAVAAPAGGASSSDDESSTIELLSGELFLVSSPETSGKKRHKRGKIADSGEGDRIADFISDVSGSTQPPQQLSTQQSPQAKPVTQSTQDETAKKVFVSLTDKFLCVCREKGSDPFISVPISDRGACRASVQQQQQDTAAAASTPTPAATAPADVACNFSFVHELYGRFVFCAPSAPAARRWVRSLDFAISAVTSVTSEQILQAEGCRIFPEQLKLTTDIRIGAGGIGVVKRGKLLNRFVCFLSLKRRISLQLPA